MSIATIPGGQSKGTPITQADEKSLSYWVNRISGDLEANPNKKFADKDRAWLTAARAELARRKGGAPTQTQAPAQQPGSMVHQGAPIQRASPQGVVGSYREPNRVNQLMAEAHTWSHVVTPAPACGTIPEGCSVTVSAVMIDPAETYEVEGGKVCLSKTALDRIAGAAGISWDPRESRRLDDGSDPHYCHYKAVCTVRDFDGTPMTRQGEVEIDLRDGSDEANSSTPKSLAIKRKFILRHAESKAMNRAIRKLGIRGGYKPDELQKPFVCLRTLFTGETRDPDLKREFARGIMEQFHGSHRAAYGESPAALPQYAPPPMQAGHAPPPLGAVPSDDEAIEPSYFADEPPAQQQAAPPAPPTPKPPSAPVKTDEERARDIDRGGDQNDARSAGDY